MKKTAKFINVVRWTVITVEGSTYRMHVGATRTRWGAHMVAHHLRRVKAPVVRIAKIVNGVIR